MTGRDVWDKSRVWDVVSWMEKGRGREGKKENLGGRVDSGVEEDTTRHDQKRAHQSKSTQAPPPPKNHPYTCARGHNPQPHPSPFSDPGIIPHSLTKGLSSCSD